MLKTYNYTCNGSKIANIVPFSVEKVIILLQQSTFSDFVNFTILTDT